MNKEKLFKVRDKRNKDWFYIDNDYLNGLGKHLGPVGIAVYVSLCRHANNETQQSFPSQETIAKEINVTTKTVKKYIGLLRSHNVVNVAQRRSEDGQFLHNIYVLMDKEVWQYPEGTKLPTVPGGTRFHHRGELGSITGGNEVPPNKTNNNKTNNNKTKDLFFDQFWKEYPKKVGKVMAQKSFKKLNVSEDLLKEIFKGLNNYKETEQWQKDNGKYIPNPETFLNQKRWNDDLSSCGEVIKKPYYYGDKLVEKNGKRYVIKNGEWLEFAGQEKDLEYK